MISNYKNTYLDKLLNTFDIPEPPQPDQSHSFLPSTGTHIYDLTKILKKNKKKNSKSLATIPKLQFEIKTIKTEFNNLKQAQQKHSSIVQLLFTKLGNDLDSNRESNSNHDIEHELKDHTLTNIEHILKDLLHILTQIISKSIS